MSNEQWLMCLRKSRQDDPNETIEETLQKHETMLQEVAVRTLGFPIPEENIYRDIISGEHTEDSEVFKRLLARIEDPSITGIIVKDCSRLSRADLESCGRLINIMRYTKTLVRTPMRTFNLEDKFERKAFQNELINGNDYLEYTKEVLWYGRTNAVKAGKFIARFAPYGYDKVKIGKDCTLVPNDNAEIVRMIFDMYNDGNTYYQIACFLNESGIPSPTGGKWPKDTVRHILRNHHYDGKVVFNKIKNTTIIENGKRITKRLMQPKEEVVIAEGKHPALVTHEVFQKAQELLARNPSVRSELNLSNPFANIMVCAGCGRAIVQHPYAHAETRLQCKHRPPCFRSAKMSEIEDAIITALERVELPSLEAKLKNGEGKSIEIQKRMLEKLENQMKEFHDQEEMQFELLETKKYTPEVFERRNKSLRQKMEETQKKIYEAKSTMPKEVNYSEKIVLLKDAISALRNPNISANEKNRFLKAIVDKIEYSNLPPVDRSAGFKKGESEPKIRMFLNL